MRSLETVTAIAHARRGCTVPIGARWCFRPNAWAIIATRGESSDQAVLQKIGFAHQADVRWTDGQDSAPRAKDSRLHRRLQQLEKLDGPERRQIMQVLDTLLESAQLKRKSQGKAVA